MSKLEDIKKILKDRLVDKIDFSDMQKDYEESYYRRFMKELESWQQEAEKIITDSGVILQGDIKAGDIHRGDAKKIKLPLELPVSTYDMHYIKNAIDILIMVKTIQKQLASCETREDRQRLIDLINLGRSFRMAEVTFHYPQITDDVICEKNRQVARKKAGVEGPVKQTIRRLGKKQDKPTFETILSKIKELGLSDQDKDQVPLHTIIIDEVDEDEGIVYFYMRNGVTRKKITFAAIRNYVSTLFPHETTRK